ncbi:GON-4-like protein [Chiloscyllium plagiosum]|uniref:GON-4-like protein n=1 Tax=Chiloscyllium plagiosum TaxID=36176 RepID=UPI001CB80C76|nr:GON-4-like protein [Chiloscyllium plagiosum]
MMKAAMFDTEQPHLFEPKMTRSKLKEVVEKGVVPPTWNLSPIKSKESKAPQFIDIPLEEEDSSDEEYRPEEEEEEEDETAEESFMESDAESTSSSPAGSGRPRSRQEVLETEEESSSAEVSESGSSVGLCISVPAVRPSLSPLAAPPSVCFSCSLWLPSHRDPSLSFSLSWKPCQCLHLAHGLSAFQVVPFAGKWLSCPPLTQ